VVDIGVPSRWINSPQVENSGKDSPTTTPKNELSRHFGTAEQRGEMSLSFASNPTTTSNHGSRSTTSNHGSGSNHGSRSGSSDGKHSNEDAADVAVETDHLRNKSFPRNDSFPRADYLRNTSFPVRPGADQTWTMPPLPTVPATGNFPREMADCLRELLSAQNGAVGEVPPMPPSMPDTFAFKDFMPPFELPPSEASAPRDSKDKPRVQYVPVPMISTPYGFCPLPPMNVMPGNAPSGYAFQPTEEALREAVAACPEGFTLMPAAEVYKEYPDLQQQQKKFNANSYAYDKPHTPIDVPLDYSPTTSPMLESFIPGGRGTTVSATNGSGNTQMMLEKLLPDGRQRKPRLREDTNRKVFVGGLNPSTTAEGLRTYFEQFGTVSEASVVIDKVTRTSRGFGFVMFESEIPAGLLEMQHIIESRRCGVRDYGDARENESSA
jgi:hypothetical protein